MSIKFSRIYYEIVAEEEIASRRNRIAEFAVMLGKAIANDDTRAQWAISNNVKLLRDEMDELKRLTGRALDYLESVMERRMRESREFRDEIRGISR